MKRTSMILLTIAGGIIGVAVVRIFFLNAFQVMGWKLFWNNLFNIHLSMIKHVFESATFGKCLLGFIIGGIIGAIVGKIFKN